MVARNARARKRPRVPESPWQKKRLVSGTRWRPLGLGGPDFGDPRLHRR